MKFVIAAFVASMALALVALAAPSRKPAPPPVEESALIRVVSRVH
ncbi:hypothetical protein [Phenylobacterium kunshanense]|nr:hypothetical protein [Phenylobacterium kunshanense]